MSKSSRKKNKIAKGNISPEQSSGIIETLQETKKQMSSLSSNYRKSLGNELQRLVIIADQLKRDQKQRTELYNDKFWDEAKKRPNPEKKKDLLNNILLFVCGREGNGRKDASFYGQALNILLNDGVRNDQIAIQIFERGGLRTIVEDYREKNRKRKLTKHDPNSENIEIPEGSDEDIVNSDSNNSSQIATKAIKNASTKSSSNTGSTRNAVVEKVKSYSKGIFIDVNSKQMKEILEAEEGTKLRFTVEVQSPEKNGFVNLKLNKHQFL